ncbi:MAG: peptidylprolyl isomerase [Solidesulfovibrio sp. DCME]|uniref:peptidylprolyl isomerase n=1 Tax=Solidesulfovibrio sp. DCME TaxID=3447380 RepID=UPI003D09B56D
MTRVGRPGRRAAWGGLAGRVVALALASCLALGGCGADVAEEPGVVAVVGGEPIRLADVQARHDLLRIGQPEADNPGVERLRAEYGAVVADLIVARLAAQELARRKLSVTEAEIDAAVAEARSGYSEEAFARLLQEERIDAARWREVLADRLALEKLSREVLRPGLRVDVTEAAKYYKDHIDAFAQPARIMLARVRGEDLEAVKAAQAAVRKSGPAALAGLAGVTVAEADLPEANLPMAWREAVKGVNPGGVTAVLPEGKGGAFFVVTGRRPATVLDPAKAYSRVEATLSAKKLESAFTAWLDTALAEGRIKVSRQLLASAGTAQGPEAARDPTPDELALARAEAAAREGLTREARKALAQKARLAKDGAGPAEDGVAAPAIGAPEPVVPPRSPARSAAESPAGRPAEAPPVAAPAATPTQAPAVAPSAVAPAVAPTAAPVAASAAPPAEAPAVAALAPVAAPPPVAVAEEVPADLTADGQPGPVDASPAPPPQPATAPPSGVAATALPEPASPASPAPDATGEAAATAGVATAAAAKPGVGEVVISAIKASWILYTVDDGQEQRVYLKPGKPFTMAYAKKLTVRPGSPSEFSYRAGGRETTVVVGKKESRVLTFP